MRCVTINETGQVIDVNPQPVNLTECQLVIPTGDQLPIFVMPESKDLASAFGYSFSAVISVGLVGFCCGRFISMLTRS